MACLPDEAAHWWRRIQTILGQQEYGFPPVARTRVRGQRRWQLMVCCAGLASLGLFATPAVKAETGEAGEGTLSRQPKSSVAAKAAVPAKHGPVAAHAVTHVDVGGHRYDFAFPAAQHEPDATTRLSAELLRDRDVTTLRGLERVAPNLTMQSINGTASTNFYLRGAGFNDFTQNNMPPVLTYMDDVAYPYAAMSNGLLFDLADAAVDPGPVGTKHGQSTTGGEVRLRTNDPTSTWHYGAMEDIASYARSRSEAYVSGPLAKGWSFRLAGQTRQGGGWQYNPTNGAHLGDADLWALRGKLRWQPNDRTTIQLGGHFVQDNSQVVTAVPVYRLIGSQALPGFGMGRQAEWSSRPEFANLVGRGSSLKPSEHNQYWGADLRIIHDFGPATFTAISAFETERQGEYTDQDGTALAQADTYRTIDANVFTQEARLNGAALHGRLNWVVGAYYQRSRMNQRFFFDYTDYTARGYMMATSFGMNQESVSEFGNVSYRLPHNVTIWAGLLHELDDRGITGLTSQIFGGTTRTFTPESTAANQFAGQVGVSWQFLPQALLYYKMSKGFKPGGFTANNTQVQAQLDPFKPETVLTYELGLKSDPIPGRLRLNGAAFYNDFHNQQVVGTVLIPNYGPLSEITNAPKSQSWGFEATLEAHPFGHLYLLQNIGWQRGDFQNFPNVDRAATNAYYKAHNEWKAIERNFDGVDNGSPKLTLNGEATWRQPLPTGYRLDFGPDWQYRGSQAIAVGGTGFYRLPPYFLLGAHATLHSPSQLWDVTVYARNILDRHYAESGGMATTTYFYIPGEPRFIGGRIACHF
ncbi:TonB-dependent receptor [Acetobacter ghanensis]|uniref:TonB-dependent receptor n=1 Tax=Acetobacter ghanensis TaxID=431306 RepID=A0A0U5BHS6_9PROT|nr:TonB-dependent receptor [Acetobacter ghanensis]CEF55004.1 TonB-dependent receptor [Acetobacter ghanensis]